MYFFLKSLLQDAWHSVHSSVLVVEMNCHLHLINEFFTLYNNFTTERIFEEGVQTVHVLVVETDASNR